VNEQPWWRPVEIDDAATAFWRIGELRLWASRHPREWRLAALRDEQADAACEHALPCETAVPEVAVWTRHGFRRAPARLRLQPALPDRPVVLAADVPFQLPPGEELAVYVSLPLWVRVLAGAEEVPLLEEPVTRLSDTWFGPLAGEGELCYAKGTSARLDLAEIPARLHRAVAPVRIRNGGGGPLPLAGVKLPAPFLSLYAGADGHVWTEALTLAREQEGELATLELEPGAPREAGEAESLAPPRVRPERKTLVRAFGGLLDRARRKGNGDRSAKPRGFGVVEP